LPKLPSETETLATSVTAGDVRALGKAITLIESSRMDHRETANGLIEKLLPATGKAVRVGLTGIPGVGKSTFIESLGLHLIDQGHRVAVLAVDPSSNRSGGSILGDKTRMEKLSRHEDAFIRPSPSGGTLGGVTRRTREAILCVEAAGFDVVIVETVGVGQSEISVADLVDVFVLLLAPAGGDELQGLKKGIVEIADLVAVNKNDGNLIHDAERTRHDYAQALSLLQPLSPVWVPKVLKCSAQTPAGINEVWDSIERCYSARQTSGEIIERRNAQALAWMWSEVQDLALDRINGSANMRAHAIELEHKIIAGDVSPTSAANSLFEAYLENLKAQPKNQKKIKTPYSQSFRQF
jgi:LAO/AO transport system kinase